MLVDDEGARATLLHPYTHRGRSGAEALLRALTEAPQWVRFVAGSVRIASDRLCIQPTAVVCERDGARRMIQPWIDPFSGKANAEIDAHASTPGDPVTAMLSELETTLGELVVLGLRRADGPLARRMIGLGSMAEAGGFRRMGASIAALGAALDRKQRDLRWDARPAAMLAAQLLALVCLGQQLEE